MIVNRLKNFFEFNISIPNQVFVCNIINVYMYISVLVSLVTGYIKENLLYCFCTFITLLLPLLIIVIPNWSCLYNRKKVTWISAKTEKKES